MNATSAVRTGRGRRPMSDRQRTLQRLEISRAAVELFREHGVAATSGEQIAEAVGLSVRTLWRYFRTKESCVEPLLARTADVFLDAVRSCPPGRALEEHILDGRRDPDAQEAADNTAALAVVALTRDEPELRAIWLVVHERAEGVLARFVAARTGGDLGSVTVRVQAAALAAALRISTEGVAAALRDDPAGGIDGAEAGRRLVEALRTATRTLS